MKIEETLKALRKGKKICQRGECYYLYLDTYKKELVGARKEHIEPIAKDNIIVLDGKQICDDDSGYDIYDGCLLDEEEHEYLDAIVYPFREDIISITKLHAGTNLVRIKIRSKNDMDTYTHVLSEEWFGTMKEGREYTLEELELK